MFGLSASTVVATRPPFIPSPMLRDPQRGGEARLISRPPFIISHDAAARRPQARPRLWLQRRKPCRVPVLPMLAPRLAKAIPMRCFRGRARNPGWKRRSNAHALHLADHLCCRYGCSLALLGHPHRWPPSLALAGAASYLQRGQKKKIRRVLLFLCCSEASSLFPYIASPGKRAPRPCALRDRDRNRETGIETTTSQCSLLPSPSLSPSSCICCRPESAMAACPMRSRPRERALFQARAVAQPRRPSSLQTSACPRTLVRHPSPQRIAVAVVAR
ncbi:hypothetical protein C8T65DRAFT_295334 [Cerioporus squamosus]|nr:hypothetical protein C8T65DRAFT_295334 [Cerioporus squamosus]